MRRLAALLLALTLAASAEEPPPLAGTAPLTDTPDRSAKMLDGIGRWLEREAVRVEAQRAALWKTTPQEPARYDRLRRLLGAVDDLHPGSFEEVTAPGAPPLAPASVPYTVHRVRWPVLEGVNGEGLLFRPKAAPRAAVIVLPDADELPEQSRIAPRLARAGCLVLVPVLVDRGDRWSGSEAVPRWTNQPHREWIYRQGFDVGRTIIGYEVEKVLAARQALSRLDSHLSLPNAKFALAGDGEGGLVALHCSALERFQVTLVSGYFGPHRDLYQEPIYRNLFGGEREFGNAELAIMAARRRVLIEPSPAPAIAGPPAPTADRKGAAPGAIVTPDPAAVLSEVMRAINLSGNSATPIELIQRGDASAPAGSPEALRAFLKALDIAPDEAALESETPAVSAPQEFADERQHRTILELERYTQSLIAVQERVRQKEVWAKLKPGPEWDQTRAALRDRLWRECIGKIEVPRLALQPRSRVVRDRPKWTGYEVELDVFPDVIAWGWLLVPKDLKPGERRPVVVCQHGLDGLPSDTVDDDAPGFRFYKAFAARLAEQGYIVYAPHNPYRGKDKFRELQRRANPLGLSLFSFILAQHDATLDWLGALPFVDPHRIAFYGLSYGGKTAMRVPALLDRYCLSICSGDFNEWIRKMALDDAPFSYVFTPEYEMYEWNLAAVANYAEMAMLIAPRPFMVERGHDDGVAVDEWVGYEYAKVLHGYSKLKVPGETEIEWFDGPHTIHGVGTFDFLRRHLHWPDHATPGEEIPPARANADTK